MSCKWLLKQRLMREIIKIFNDELCSPCGKVLKVVVDERGNIKVEVEKSSDQRADLKLVKPD